MPPSGRVPRPGRARKTQPLDQDHHHSQRQRENTSSVLLSVQQRVLGIFNDALQSGFTPDLPRVSQEIKGHLYARDFDQAFGKEAYREAYAIRWSASRALAYLIIFHDLRHHLLPRMEGRPAEEATDSSSSEAVIVGDALASRHEDPGSTACSTDQDPRFSVTCLGGGGGAEAVALATWSSGLAQLQASSVQSDVLMSVDIVDRADWSEIMGRLEPALNDQFKGRSGDIKQTQDEIHRDGKRFRLSFHQGDVLDLAIDSYRTALETSNLVTLMFTLNELYTTSKSKATAFLLQLGSLVRNDARLLVVDSPGSYSTVQLGKENVSTEKRYPMCWLLDHTLLVLSREEHGRPQWEKIVTDESRWYRLPDGLQYPIDLENTRYQIHLFRRI